MAKGMKGAGRRRGRQPVPSRMPLSPLNDGRALDKRRATVRWERQSHVPTHSGAGAAAILMWDKR